MELFSINCTTCNARLSVRSMRAIGQILACPKCHSMVQIAAPAGWTPPVSNGKPARSPEPARRQAVETTGASARVAAACGQSDPLADPTLLDSDFSDVPHDSTNTPAESGVDLVPPAAHRSPTEVLGRRVAVMAGLIAGLAFTLFVLLRSGQDDPAEPVPPLAQASSTSEDTGETTDNSTIEVANPAEASAHKPPDSPVNAAKDADGNVALPTPPVEYVTPVKVEDDGAVVGESQQATKPVAMPAAPKDVVSLVQPSPMIADHEAVADLTSEVSAEDRAVAARLEERIAAIDFQGAKLSDLVEFLSRMTNVTLRFDPEALVAADVATTARVSVQQTDTTAARVLDAALAKLGLTYEIRDGQAVIVTRPDPPARPQAAKGEKPTADDAEPAANDSADPAADLRLDAVTP